MGKTIEVELLVGRATDAGAQNKGDKIQVPTDEAQRMVAAGQCKPVRGLADLDATEKATAR